MVNQVEFWQQRWVNNQTGFHEDQVNPYLEKHLSLLSLPEKSTVFLPLCGKSKDLIWLADLGYHVIGVECSELAVSTFFTENNLTVDITQQDNFQLWRSGNITLYCGDFYELKSIWFESVNAIFDRAALVALPQALRTTYAQHLQSICPDATILLVSLEYLENEMTGPPFAVFENEIKELYHSSSELTRVESNDVLSMNEKFKERGLSSLIEEVYLVQPK